MNKDSVLIVSGGMDSITMLYEYKERIALGISFDYGSNHNAREIPFAAMHCERLGIKHIVINLGFMHQYFKSSLLEGAEADGEAAVRRHAVAEGVEVEMESIRIHATTEHLLAIVGCSVLRSVLSRSVPPARRRRAQPTHRMAHTAPHSATPPPMRHTRGGKRRLSLPGQKRYGLSQIRSIGLSFFERPQGARE